MKGFNPLADCIRYWYENSVRQQTDPVAFSPLSSSNKKDFFTKVKNYLNFLYRLTQLQGLKLSHWAAENDDSGIAVNMLFRQRTDSASLNFSPSFLPSLSSLSPLAPITDQSASAQLWIQIRNDPISQILTWPASREKPVLRNRLRFLKSYDSGSGSDF